MKYALISATSMLVMLVAVLSFAAGIWYADTDHDATQYTVKEGEGDDGSWITITESGSSVGWIASSDGAGYINIRPAVRGTKYINLNPAVQEDLAPIPSRQPDTASNCDGVDCQENG